MRHLRVLSRSVPTFDVRPPPLRMVFHMPESRHVLIMRSLLFPASSSARSTRNVTARSIFPLSALIPSRPFDTKSTATGRLHRLPLHHSLSSLRHFPIPLPLPPSYSSRHQTRASSALHHKLRSPDTRLHSLRAVPLVQVSLLRPRFDVLTSRYVMGS